MKKDLALLITFVLAGTFAAAQTAEEVARSFLTARDSWDHATTIDLFADDYIIANDIVRFKEDYVHAYPFMRASNWRWTTNECHEFPFNNGDSAEVICTYSIENDWLNAVGHDPVDGSFSFRIKDGKITALYHSYSIDIWRPNAMIPFRNYVAENHPEDLPVIFTDRFPEYFSPEGIALIEKYTKEFVVSLE